MSSEVSLEAREQPGLIRRSAAVCARAACSQVGLVILVVVYVLLGAVLFEYLESGPDVQKRSAIQRSREECLKELWAITDIDKKKTSSTSTTTTASTPELDLHEPYVTGVTIYDNPFKSIPIHSKPTTKTTTTTSTESNEDWAYLTAVTIYDDPIYSKPTAKTTTTTTTTTESNEDWAYLTAVTIYDDPIYSKPTTKTTTTTSTTESNQDWAYPTAVTIYDDPIYSKPTAKTTTTTTTTTESNQDWAYLTAVTIYDAPIYSKPTTKTTTTTSTTESNQDWAYLTGVTIYDDPIKPISIYKRLNVLYERNWTRLVHEQLQKFESSIVAAARRSEAQASELALDSKWTFSGAVVYCITLITTIGYGNVSPRTAAGRAATVAYAAAGVPLTLACLAGLGASLAKLARLAWLKATKRKVPNTWRKDGEHENHLQLHEQQRLLPQPTEHNQYTSFPPRARPGTVRARAGDRGQYSQVFERAPTGPRAATLGRVKRTALADEPHSSSSSLQTQTLDRKKIVGTKCQATVHGPSRARARGTIQRPRGAVIEQLIAEECGELPSRSQEDLDDSEDPDEVICPHDTPSRVPLIWNEESHKNKSCAVPSSSASTSVQQHMHGIEHCHIPVSIILFLLLAYICIGAAIFSAWENWSFLDAAYFCFIALATIGFGDFVPTSFLTSKQSTESSKSEYVQMIACCAYLVFGLILIAMSFTLLQDEVVSRCSQLANSLGLSKQ